MNSRDPDAARRTILVSGPTTSTDAGLSLLRRLADQAPTTIAGVFVEELSLLRAAALPVTREIGRVSGALRALELPRLEMDLRRQAEQMRARLSAIAGELQLPWSFAISRGSLITEALGLLADADVILLQGFRREPYAASRSPGGTTPTGTTNAVLFQTGAASERLLEVAAALSRQSNQHLELWLPATTSASIAMVRDRVATLLGPGAPVATLRPFAGTLPELSRALAATTVSTLILPAQAIANRRAELEALLGGLNLTLVLVS